MRPALRAAVLLLGGGVGPLAPPPTLPAWRADRHRRRGARRHSQIWAGVVRLTAPLRVVHGTADKLTAPSGSHERVARAPSTDRTLELYGSLALAWDPRDPPAHDGVLGIADAATPFAGLRLGRAVRDWRGITAGEGLYASVSFSEIGEARFWGVQLGLHLSGSR